jgi:glycosyltransferase involved in cell wall biosynthesis
MTREAGRPRVLFVNHTATLGGGELSLYDLATGMRDRCRVLLFQDGPFRELLRDGGVDVRVLRAGRAVLRARRDAGGRPGAGTALGVASLALRLAARAVRYDVLYANSQKALVACGPAGWLTRRPVIWHLRDLLTDEHFSVQQRRVAVGLARRFAARVIANSNATRDAYVAAGGDKDHVRVVYNGIDPAPFDRVPAESSGRIRAEMGLTDEPIVGLFGRIATWKGQNVLIEALPRLPGVHALIVGEALFAADRGMPAALRGLADRLGVGERVHLVGYRRDVPELMHACDVIVHASTSAEPFGRVIVEGMLAGRPVVASAAGGALELIVDGRTGRLTRSGDVGDLADAISQLLSDSALRATMAAAAGKEARERFSLDRVREKVNAVIREAAPVSA